MKRKALMFVSVALALAAPLAAPATEISLLPLPFLLKNAAFVGTVEITSVTPLKQHYGDVKSCGYRYRAKTIDVLKGSARELSFIAESRRKFIGSDMHYFLIASKGNGQSKKGICAIPSSGYYILPFQPMLFPLYTEGQHNQHTWMLVEREGGVTWKIAGPKSNINIAFRSKPLEIGGRNYTAWSWRDFRKAVLAELKEEQ